MMNEGNPPVSVGDELDVKIEAVGEKGDGVAKVKGFVLFVPNTNAGDTKRIRVTKVLRKLGFAEVIGDAEGKPESNLPPPPAEEPSPEDSEDFGEEDDGDSDDGDDDASADNDTGDDAEDEKETKDADDAADSGDDAAKDSSDDSDDGDDDAGSSDDDENKED